MKKLTNEILLVSGFMMAQLLSGCATDSPASGTSAPTPSSSPDVVTTNTILFGGMFGYTAGAATTNPLSSATAPIAGCPSGYTQSQILGSSLANGVVQDNPVYICTRQALSTDVPLANFGGIYGNGSLDGVTIHQFPNPMTKAQSCPAGYTIQTLLNTPGVDWDLYLCYESLPSTVTLADANSFLGMFGAFTDNTQSPAAIGWYPNPVTGGPNCQNAPTAGVAVYGALNSNFPIYICPD